MLARLSLRLRIVLIFAGLATGVLLIIGLAIWMGGARMAESGVEMDAAVNPLLQIALISGFVSFGMIIGVWFLFDRHVAQPIEALAGGLRTGQAPNMVQTRYLADLGPAARDVALAQAQASQELSEAVQEHTAEHAREKATLEAILSDFGAGAVMADQVGRVLFYNAAAAQLLPGLALDRPLTQHLRAGALDAARARLSGDVEATDLTVLTVDGKQLSGRMRHVDDTMLLILRERPADRAEAREAAEALRRHAAALVPMLEALDGPVPAELLQVIRAEGQGLAAATRKLSQADARNTGHARALLSELATGLEVGDKAGMNTPVYAEAGPLNAVLRMLDGHLRDAGYHPLLTAQVTDLSEPQLLLGWDGPSLPMDRLEALLSDAPDPDQPDRSAADLLALHDLHDYIGGPNWQPIG